MKMGRLAKELGQWDGTRAAARAVEQTAYALAREMFGCQVAAVRHWECEQKAADEACDWYMRSLSRATGTRIDQLAIVARHPSLDDTEELCVEVHELVSRDDSEPEPDSWS